MKQLIYSIILVLMCNNSQAKEPDNAQLVEIITIEPRLIQKTVNLIGTVKAANVVTIRAATSGIVANIAIEEGARVKKGDEIATLENKEIKYQARLAIEQANIAKLKHQTLKKHAQNDIISKSELASNKQAWLRAEIAANNAIQALNKTIFKAPFSGICGVFKIAPGDPIKPDDAIVTIYNNDNKIVYIDIPDNLINDIKVNQKILVEHIPGKITAVQRVIDPETYMGLAKAQLLKPSANISNTVNTKIIIHDNQNSFGVPRAAIVYYDSKPQVFVAKDNKAIRTPVTIGIVGDKLTEIISGIAKGSLVIISGHKYLGDTDDILY